MKTCTICGTANPDGMRFCGGCGASLAGDKPAIGAAARRQVTVVFCDLVGSTPLSQRVDPEDLGTILLAFRNVVAAAARRHGGSIMRFLGDGVLLCFGYPVAHEDDAINAVRCGHEVVEAMRAVDLSGVDVVDWVPATRIGIHTGLTLVGALGTGETGEVGALVGEVPNLAARIQEHARAHRVVISSTTYRLVERRIECRRLGTVALKGVREAMDLFEVVNVRPNLDDPLRVREAVAVAPTGREAVYNLVHERWILARDGAGQVGTVIAEAGMGKTHLMRAVAARILAEGARVLIASCLAETSGSVFHPIATMLRRELDLEGATIEHAQTAIRSTMENLGGDVASSLAVATLLAFDQAQGGAHLLSAAVDRAQAFALIAAWIASAAAGRPTLFVVEDLHLADPSTLEFLEVVIDQVAGSPCLLLATSRPGIASAWSQRSFAFTLQLGPLPTPAVLEMVRSLATARSLSAEAVSHIARRSDGVPLYIEEITKATLEQAANGQADDQAVIGRSQTGIPPTLQETLLSRLDRLGPAKSVAQLAACLGTEFSRDLLLAVQDGAAVQLDRLLDVLVRAEILVRHGLGAGARYSFRHGLLQEIAHDSLLRAQRRQLHGRIADVIISQFPGLVARRPEEVAHHCAAGDMPEKAIQYWRAAAHRAYVSSGFVEAVEFLRSACRQVLHIKGQARDRIELSLQVDLGTALIATHGEASPEVEKAYARAEALLRQSDGMELTFSALRGLQSFYQVRGPLDTSRRLAERLGQVAEASGDKVARVEAMRRLGWCLFCLGDFSGGHQLLRDTLALYEPSNARRHIVQHSVDPAVLARINLAWLKAFAGAQAKAEEEIVSAIGYGESLGHGLSLAYALGIGAAVHQTLDQPDRAAQRAGEALALARRCHLPYWIAFGTLMQGWAMTVRGDAAALGELDSGLAAYRASGARLFVPYGLALRADVLLRLGRHAAAEEVLAVARSEAAEVQCRFIWPELLRLTACGLLQRSDVGHAVVVDAFDTALAAADEVGAGVTALRIVGDGRSADVWPATGLAAADARAHGIVARNQTSGEAAGLSPRDGAGAPRPSSA